MSFAVTGSNLWKLCYLLGMMAAAQAQKELAIAFVEQPMFWFGGGLMPIQSCFRIRRGGDIEYLLGCPEEEYTLTGIPQNLTGDPNAHCHVFVNLETNQIVSNATHLLYEQNTILFTNFTEEDSGYYSCYTGDQRDWQHSGWVLLVHRKKSTTPTP